MVGTVVVVLAAAKSVTSALLLLLWPAFFAWKGYVDQKFISKMSLMMKVMFLPCLGFHVISTGMSMPFIRESWLLVVLGVLFLLIGFGIGSCLSALADIRAALRPWFVLSVMIPNMIALPLVLVEAICHEREVGQAAIAECVHGATTRLFTVTLTHTFIIWSVCPAYVRSRTRHAPAVAAEPARGVAAEKAGLRDPAGADGPATEVFGRPAEVPGQRELQDLAVADLGADATLPATIGHAVKDGVLPTTLEDGPATPSKRRMEGTGAVLQRFASFLLDNPPVTAGLVAIIVAICPPLHQLLYGPSAPLSFLASGISLVGKASPGVVNLVSGSSLGLQLLEMRRDDPLGLRGLGVSKRSMALLVMGKIVIAPACNLCLVLLVLDWLPRDFWSRLVLFFQPAGVTANILMVLAQLVDQPEAAQLVALAIIPQMLLYIPIATVLIALGIAWNEGLE